jgi:serine protease Do
MISPFSPTPQTSDARGSFFRIFLPLIFMFFAGFAGALLAVYAPPDFITNTFGAIERVAPKQSATKDMAGEVSAYQPQTSQEDQIIAVAKKASPSVVSVVATKDVPVASSPLLNDPFFQQFFPEFNIPNNGGTTQRKQVSAGTGFVVSRDGLILTNKHVVSDSEADYSIIDTNGVTHTAEVLARDPVEDLAILRAQGISLPALDLGNSDSVQQGQTVIAIGNALGEFNNTVSVGVVSGLRRNITASGGGVESERLQELIQTDAAINPGNSGGPLLNLRGEVIGANVAMAQGAENIGFAIPINRAKRDIQQVQEKGKISYPFLGVRYMLITKEIQKQNSLSVDYGALIVRGETRSELAVTPGSPADKAGLVENDIILEIEGKKITQDYTLADAIARHNVGDTISLRILHRGDQQTVQVVLSERS